MRSSAPRRAGMASLAVALAAVLAVTVAACGTRDDDGAPVASDLDVEPSGGTEQLLDYRGADGEGVTVVSASQTTRLEGAPDDFLAFVTSELQDLEREDADCTTALDGSGGTVALTVDQLRTGPDGVAVGSVFACGGARVLWAVDDGAWRRVWGGQDVWPCRVPRRYDVPPSFAEGGCLAGRRLVDYP